MKKHLPRMRELQPKSAELRSHATPEEKHLRYDAHRTAYLERYGLLVIRFRNWDVKTRFAGVCRRIDAVVRERIADTVSL